MTYYTRMMTCDGKGFYGSAPVQKKTEKRPPGAALSLDGGWVRKPTRQVKLSAQDLAIGKAEAKRRREIADEAAIRNLTRRLSQDVMPRVTAGLLSSESAKLAVDRLVRLTRLFERNYGRQPEVR